MKVFGAGMAAMYIESMAQPLPVRYLSAGREGMIIAVGERNVFVPRELSYDEDKKPRWEDINIRYAGFTEQAHSLDMPEDLVPADEETKIALAAYFEKEKQRRATQKPDFPPYKLNY